MNGQCSDQFQSKLVILKQLERYAFICDVVEIDYTADDVVMSLCFHGLPAYLTLFVGPAVGV